MPRLMTQTQELDFAARCLGPDFAGWLAMNREAGIPESEIHAFYKNVAAIRRLQAAERDASTIH